MRWGGDARGGRAHLSTQKHALHDGRFVAERKMTQSRHGARNANKMPYPWELSLTTYLAPLP